MSNKYLALYEENDKLQELLNTMQFRIQQANKEGGGLESDLANLGSTSDCLVDGDLNDLTLDNLSFFSDADAYIEFKISVRTSSMLLHSNHIDLSIKIKRNSEKVLES